MINPIFLVLLLPIAGYIIFKSENLNFNPKKITAGLFIILLLLVTPAFTFQPVYADHNSKVIKLNLAYPADAGFIDVPLPMRIDNIENTIIFLSFSTPDTADQADTSRRWELIDDRTLRVFGESNTPTGNNAGNMVIYIIELRSDEFDITNQNFVFNMTADETPDVKTIELTSPVNASKAWVIYNGLENLADETSWGSEEFPLVHLNDTHIEFQTTEIANTDQVYGFSVIHANLTGVLVQRGTGILDGTVGEVTDTITPPIAVDRDHTIVLITGRIEPIDELNADPDEVMVQVTLDSSNDIVIHRDDDAPLDFIYEWQTISFPINFVNVTHGEIAMVDTETEITDTITPVRDFDKSLVISGTGTPFGYGTGSCDTGTAGAMDRCMNRLILTDQDTVTAIREDDTGTNVVNYQVIQILETEVAEEPQGTTSFEQIVKIQGTIPTGIESDFTISPELTNVNKTLVFVSFESDGTGGGDPSGGRKSYEIFNSTTLRFFGNSDPTVTNPPLNFTAYLVEFSDSSPVVVQNEFLTYQTDLDAGEKEMHMSPINTTGSSLINLGRHLTGDDSSVGAEEIDRVRILTSNTWGYDVDSFQNFGDGATTLRVDIADYNDNQIFSQRGQLSMSTTTASVTPPIAIVQNQTMLLFSHTTGDGDLTASPDTSTVHATIDATGDIDFFRPVATGTIEINWEVVSFPDTLLSIEHGIHHQAIGTRNATSTVTPVGTFSNSLAIGTEGMMGYGTGSGDEATDATASFLDIISTVELEDNSTVRVVRGTSTGDFDIGFQVIEYVGGQVFNQTITDTVTLPPLDPNFNINKTAVDFSTFVDVSTNKNITKLGTDVVGSSDTVNTNSIFVIELSDQGEAVDVLALNITKLNQEVISGLDDLGFDIAKGLVDTATVIDQVDPQLVALLLLTDLASTNDEVRLAITKLLEDDVVTSDEINFVVDKLLQDTTIVSDLSEASVTFGIDELDTITASDLVILDITRQLSDVASAIDDLNLEATKVLLDTTTTVDQIQASTDTDVDETDIVTIPDDFVIDVTKLIQDIATIQDQVVLLKLIDLAILDTVIIDDPSIFFIISSVVPNGTGTPAGSGGGIPSGTPFFQRLVGLSIISELFFIAPADRVPSDFIIETFGNENLPVVITNIQADQQFASWFEFSSFPDTLLFDTTVDTSRTFSDPARFKNTALDSFVLSVPSISCEDLDPFITPVPCIDPIIYEAPVTFTFTKGGVEFREKHIVTIDATQPVICDSLCELVDFITQNYWWLAGILIVFMMMYFLGVPIITGKRIRTVRRVDSRHFDSFEAGRHKKKFKRGKRK